jgi:TPR repeat protein
MTKQRTVLDIRLAVLGIAALIGGSFCLAATPASAQAPNTETRRAFIVGVQRYSDRDIQPLTRSDSDAADVASDLQDMGFDKKNVTLATDIRSKDDFDKKFQAFLKTVNEGDDVFFFFSGHGIGVEATNTNYLLLADLQSLKTYTRNQLLAGDRENNDIVELKMPSYEGSYETDEIPKDGVSVADITQAIAAKKPKTAFLVLDACRSVPREVENTINSGSQLLPDVDLANGFLVLYSAAYGETAVESLGADDHRRNSLFTEVLRSEMQRPGQTLIGLADRTKLVVSKFAAKRGFQQDPEYYQNLGTANTFMLVDSVGAERFPLPQQKCEGAEADWDQISKQPERYTLERHLRRFPDCKTAEEARKALVNLMNSAQGEAPMAIPISRQLDDCDRLAASDTDTGRPPEAPGVPLDQIDADKAITACNKSIKDNPRVPRFLFNLGRAEIAAAYALPSDDPRRADRLTEAHADLHDAAAAGYVAALYNLAVFSYIDTSDEDRAESDKDLKEAANQGFPPAMYELGLRYEFGLAGMDINNDQAHEWMAKAADSGYTPAMVEVAGLLWKGLGMQNGAANARRAVEWAERAASAGSTKAKRLLGEFYLYGNVRPKTGEEVDSNSTTEENDPNSVYPDPTQALLWFGRAASENDPIAQYYLADMMEKGEGLPIAQPEVAARYYRLAAHGGDEDAEIVLADGLRSGKFMIDPANGENEVVDLLNRALSQGSARAALDLAKIYRTGEFGPKDPLKAMQYAYQAIKLSVQADPTTPDGDPYYEIQAGVLLAEMAVNGQANDASGNPLLTQDEIDRLQRYYGQVDPQTRKVKVRQLWVPLYCPEAAKWRQVWVWDWGRSESPTEPQFRSLERETDCYENQTLRRTLIASFQLARKDKVPFADLIIQQIKAAQASIQ